MATYVDWHNLEAAIANKMRKALTATVEKSFQCLEYNTADFYSGGIPRVYERTYAFGSSPVMTPVTGSNREMEGSVYMDGNYVYDTGSHPSGYTVFNWAENGEAGIVGRTGTWERTEDDIQKVLENEFGRYFDRA